MYGYLIYYFVWFFGIINVKTSNQRRSAGIILIRATIQHLHMRQSSNGQAIHYTIVSRERRFLYTNKYIYIKYTLWNNLFRFLFYFLVCVTF